MATTVIQKDVEYVDSGDESSRRPAKRRRAGSRESNKSSDLGDDVAGETFFPAESLYEYQWPPNCKDAELYMLQEQVSEFLGVKSFKRKYPDLERRELDMKERNYLREKGAVTEMQVNLGLTALKTEEVLDLMAKDYPEKYKDYAAVLHERERLSITEKHKEYEVPAVDAGKIKEYIKKAVKQASEYNMLFNRDRREERQAYYDMQTSIVHVPTGKMLKLPKEATKVGAYPVMLIPGQFQEYYRKYTSDELKYFPLNTAIYGPPVAAGDVPAGAEDDLSEESSVESSAEESESSDGSGSDSSDNSSSGSNSSSNESDAENESEKANKQSGKGGGYKSQPAEQGEEDTKEEKAKEEDTVQKEAKDIPDAICGICLKGKQSNKKGLPEVLVHCSQCDNSGHPSCLEMSSELVRVIKTYPWQCMECKTCTLCGDPTHEDKMMFCDECDRGYHTFCVGLKSIPTGKWACESCVDNSDTSSHSRSQTPTTTRSGRRSRRR
ncbi:PHD finger protein 10-like isoform X2 [Ptychodera flava]|uniref:PHD finger protein 10-like isoform X2 n=1 Tax=Ptychodera flava TaxID=63121 RepID=UPI00396A8BDE